MPHHVSRTCRPLCITLILLFAGGLVRADYGIQVKVPPGADAATLAVANDLKAQLSRITGDSYTVTTIGTSDTGTNGIYVARATSASHPAAMPSAVSTLLPNLDSASRSAYLLCSDGSDWLWVAANHPLGLSSGVYDYLERLGCHWLFPTDRWTLIPSLNRADAVVTIAPGEQFVEPDFINYTFFPQGGWMPAHSWLPPSIPPQSGPTDTERWTKWMQHNRMRAEKSLGGHIYQLFMYENQTTLDDDPLYMPEVDGVRQVLPTPILSADIQHLDLQLHTTHHGTSVDDDHGGTWVYSYTDGTHNYYEDPQDYTSDSGLAKIFSDYIVQKVRDVTDVDSTSAWGYTVDPADGAAPCTCWKCRDLLLNGPYDDMPNIDSSISDRVFHLANFTADKMAAELGPDKGVSLLAYREHALVPHIPIASNVIIQLTPHYSHFKYTHLSSESYIQAWRDKQTTNAYGPFTLSIYDYWGAVFSSLGLPRQNVLTAATRMRAWYEAGTRMVGLESSTGAGTVGLAHYVGSRLAWDHSIDTEAVVDEFVELAFGPAYIPMRRLFRRWYETDYVNEFRVGYLELAESYRDIAEADQDLAASGTPEQQARLDDFKRYLHFMRLSSEINALDPATQETQYLDAIDECLLYTWHIDDTLMVQTKRVNDAYQYFVFNKLNTPASAIMAERWSMADANASAWSDLQSYNPGTLSDLMDNGADAYPLPTYNHARFAESLDDYIWLPSPDNPDPNNDVWTPRFHELNTFLIKAPGGPLTLTFETGASAPSTEGPILLTLIDNDGEVCHSGEVDATYPGTSQYDINLGTLTAGFYELHAQPTTDGRYKILVPDNAPLALKGSLRMTITQNNRLWFYVPAEVDSVFLRGRQKTAIMEPHFYTESGTQITPVKWSFDLYEMPTNGPGLYSVTAATHSSSSIELINVPSLFSFSKEQVLTSRTVRVPTLSPTGGAAMTVTSPKLTVDNRFLLTLDTMRDPGLQLEVMSGIASPPDIELRIYDEEGRELFTGPFFIPVSSGSWSTVTVPIGMLPSGTFQINLVNPSPYSRYKVVVPPDTPFSVVDGFALNNFATANRAYFNVPSGMNEVLFHAPGVALAVHDPTDHDVTATHLAHLGNDVYSLDTTGTSGLWSINITCYLGQRIRLLNLPNIMAWQPDLLLEPAP